MADNTGRKYHWWSNEKIDRDAGSLTDVCGHCGLRRTSTGEDPRPTFADSKGRQLTFTGTPNCPRTPTY